MFAGGESDSGQQGFTIYPLFAFIALVGTLFQSMRWMILAPETLNPEEAEW